MEGDLFFSFWVKEHSNSILCGMFVRDNNKQKDAVFLYLSIDNPSSSSQRLLYLAHTKPSMAFPVHM